MQEKNPVLGQDAGENSPLFDMSEIQHTLLKKQVQRCVSGEGAFDFDKLFMLINQSYDMADQERYLSDQSISVMSEELTGANETLRRQAEELRKSEERYALASKGANDGLWDFDVQSGVCFYSERWREIVGLSNDTKFDTLNQWFALVHPSHQESVKDALNRHIDGSTDRFEAEYQIRCKNGRYLWVQTRGFASRDPAGKAVRIAGSQTDISQRKKYEDQLFKAAFHDKLTGLPNRALFLDRLRQALKAFKREGGKQAALMFLDLDRFKFVNDSLGHEAGDQLLISVTKRLELVLRETDTLCRLGGDEFTLLAEEIDNQEQALGIANRIIEEITKPFFIYNQQIFISGSVGIVMIDQREEAETLMRNADLAMYQAKNNGKGRAEIFDKKQYDLVYNTMQVQNDMRSGIDRGEFIPYFQPIVDVKTGDIISLEALMRWDHPKNGIIPPLKFIPIAEETGMINGISEVLIHNVCKQLRMWRHAFGEKWIPTISINLSARQVFDQEHLNTLFQIIENSKISPNMIIFEVTESIIMENARYVGEILRNIKSKGFDIAVDDFGTGYSSLSYLATYPFDELKIDRSFVTHIGEDPKKEALVKNIINLARDLGLKTVAEGVETREELKKLQELDCDLAQGYFFAKPMSALEILDYMALGVGMGENFSKKTDQAQYLDRFSFLIEDPKLQEPMPQQRLHKEQLELDVDSQKSEQNLQ